MTKFVYTEAAVRFADLHEGLEALKAVVEKEVETLKAQGWRIETVRCHFFSWHGTRNFSMMRFDHYLVIDLLEVEPEPKILLGEVIFDEKPVAESNPTM